MGTNKVEDIRRNGKYYTPQSLAELLARPLLRDTTKFVLDPAYGDGALLLAADKVSREKGFHPFVQLYGCDKAPINGLLQKIPASQLVKENFFRYKQEKKFDLVLMNPPYVRHHFMSESAWSLYQKTTNEIIQLDSYSDLWVYFLIKSTLHLKKSGSIGAILPWSFLQAEYAQKVRAWLAKNFGQIKVLALGANYFASASERVLLLWAEDYGNDAKKISFGYSYQIDECVNYFSINKTAWEASSVAVSETSDIEMILQSYIDSYGFTRFKNLANVRIGVVTGADSFFIVCKDKSKELNITDECSIPILKSFREFHGLTMNGSSSSNMLLVFHPRNTKNQKNYIRYGRRKGYHQRSHSIRRNPWYYVTPGETPDAFFPYRCSHTPYLMLNNHDVQSTNSIHRIYFSPSITEDQMKWMQISLLSVPGQLSLEAYSRVYGEGVLKIEPRSLGNAIIHAGAGKFPKRFYRQISKALSSNNKEKALEIATKVINDAFGIPSKFSDDALMVLKELRNRRIPKN